MFSIPGSPLAPDDEERNDAHRLPVREDAYLIRATVLASPRRAASWSIAPASTRHRVGNRATAACW